MAARFLRYFPEICLLAMPFGWFAGLLLTGGEGPAAEAIKITFYVSLGIAALYLTVGHFDLVRQRMRELDGMCEVWLLSFTTSKAAATFVYFSVVFLLGSRLFGATPLWSERVFYAMIGASAVASLLSALVFFAAKRSPDGFSTTVDPLSFVPGRSQRRRQALRKARESEEM